MNLTGETRARIFSLFSPDATYTDDSIMTLAVADAFMSVAPNAGDSDICWQLVQSMQHFGRAFPHAGYGGMFRHWLRSNRPQPYGSYGNGSAMRVSSVGWLFDDLETVPEAITAFLEGESFEDVIRTAVSLWHQDTKTAAAA